jgi:hypothetical protein
MCFSAEASFAASAALLPAGVYCATRAVRGDWRFFPLGITPIAFGLQQAAEGCVWLGLDQGHPALVTRSAVVFLFFALAFWPLWIPLSLFVPESRPPAKAVLALLVLLSPVWLWLYAPLALDPDRWLTTTIVHHSIAYDTSNLPAFQVAPRMVWRAGYLVFICLPLVVARPGTGSGAVRLGAGLLVASLFGLSYLIYWYAFTSVWCFFAALVSLLLVVAFARLPRRQGRPKRAEPASPATGAPRATAALP